MRVIIILEQCAVRQQKNFVGTLGIRPFGRSVLRCKELQVMRSWNVVHLLSKLLSPAAEALRYYILEHGESYLLAHDIPLLGGSDQAAEDSGNPG